MRWIVRLMGVVSFLLLAELLFPVGVFAQTGRESDFLYARRLYEDGLYDLAVEALERYLAADPENPHQVEANLIIGDALWKEKKLDLARQAYQRAAMADPDDPRGVEALTKVADSYLAENDWLKAARAEERIAVFYPNSPAAPAALTRTARILIEHNQFNQAEAPIQQVLRQYPGSSQQREARLLWARVLADRGELEQAADEAGAVARATRDADLAVEALSFQGEWYWRLGRDPDAEAAWRSILEGYPRAAKRAEALTRMGQQRLRIGDAKQAEPLLRDALGGIQKDSLLEHEARLTLADALLLEGKPVEALLHLNRLEGTVTPSISFRKALVLEDAGRNAEAISLYRNLGQGTDSLAAGARWRVAAMLEKSGRPREAAEAWRWAEQALPSDLQKSEARYRALALTVAIEPLRALEVASVFADDYPRSARVDDAEFIRAKALLALGRRKEAVEAFRGLGEIWPVSPYHYDATSRADYIETMVLPKGDPSSKLAGLLAEFAGGRDRRDLSLRLAEVYLFELKDYSAAKKQLQELLADSSVDQARRLQARELLAESLWRNFQRETRGEDGTLLPDVAARRAAANRTITDLQQLLPNLRNENLRAETSWRLMNLEADSRSGLDSLLYVRKMLQNHLADYPNSSHAGDAYLDLGKAFSRVAKGIDNPDKGDPSIWYLEAFRDNYSSHPRFAEGLLLLADRYAKAKRFAPAEQTYRSILRLAPSPERVEAVLALLNPEKSKSSMGMGEELEWVRTHAWYHPDVQLGRRLLVQRLMDDGHYHEASDELVALGELNMDWGAGLVIEGARNQQLAWYWGQVYEGLHQPEKARDEYRRYLSRNPSGPDADQIRLKLAELRKRQGYPDAALRLYRRLLADASDYRMREAGLRGVANILFDQGQYEAAMRNAEEIVQTKGTARDTAFVYDEMAVICRYRQGHLDEARKQANAFRKKWSRMDGLYDVSARFELERGKWLSKDKNYPEAERNYNRILKNYNNSKWVPYAKYELGRDLLEQNRTDDGMKLLAELPPRYPRHPILGRVWWILGNQYAQSGDIMHAVQTYDKVLTDSAYVDVWPYVLVNQIQAYQNAGFYAGALQAAQRYLELYPEAPDAFDRQMDVGVMYLQMGQYDLAISQFRKIQPLADVEDEAAIQFYVGESLEKSGRLAESVIEYKKVDYLGKRTKMEWAITALYNAGRVLERLGQTDQALNMYQEIVRREGLASPFGRKAQEQVDRLRASKR
ncbi:MAG: tetratricopeptide repeat protein [bacterium]